MKEKDVQQEVSRGVAWLREQLGPISYTKIPDIPKGPEQRFCPRRGYDCFLVYQGRHIALELKLAKGMSLSFNALDDYQENKLLEVVEAGGTAYLFVSFRVSYSAKEAKRRGRASDILAFAYRIEDWGLMRCHATRSSVPLSEFEVSAIKIPRLKTSTGAAWDLTPLFEEKAS